MIDSDMASDRSAIDQAIALVERALSECDDRGYIYAAIDLSSALDKLKALRAQHRDT